MGFWSDDVDDHQPAGRLAALAVRLAAAERDAAAARLCEALAESGASAAVVDSGPEPLLVSAGPDAGRLRATLAELVAAEVELPPFWTSDSPPPGAPQLGALGGGLHVASLDRRLLVVGPARLGWKTLAPETAEVLRELLNAALAERPGSRPAALDAEEREALLAIHHGGSAAECCDRAVETMRRLFAAEWVLVARCDAFAARFVLSGTATGSHPDEDVPALATCSRDLAPVEGAVDPVASDWLSRQLRAAGVTHCRTASADFMGERFGVLQIGCRDGSTIAAEVRRRLGRLAFHLALALRQDAVRQAQEEALRQLREAQEQATEGAKFRALAQMAGGVAHEFNNALGGILGRAQMLQRQIAEPQVRQGLATILEIGFRAAETVKQLQEFTRERADEEFAALPAAAVWEHLAAAARRRTESHAHASGERFALEVSEGSLDGQVQANLDELAIALGNVVGNALEATAGGGVIALDGRCDARGLVLTVVDRGRGMSAEERRSCFDPFYSTKAQTGVGLGLSVTYGIISRHHGEIDLQSSPGQGTTVRISLPKVVAPTYAAQTTPRILVIDDEAALCEVLAELFSSAGFEVDSCAGGREGIERLQSTSYDLICTDLKTADLSGWEVARAAKAERPGRPVLMLTGFRDLLGPQELVAGGVDKVLGKPFTLQQVLDAAESLLHGEAT